jgi:hypothetical protein
MNANNAPEITPGRISGIGGQPVVGERLTGSYTLDAARVDANIDLQRGLFLDGAKRLTVTFAQSGATWTASTPGTLQTFNDIDVGASQLSDQVFIRASGITGPTLGPATVIGIELDFTAFVLEPDASAMLRSDGVPGTRIDPRTSVSTPTGSFFLSSSTGTLNVQFKPDQISILGCAASQIPSSLTLPDCREP